MLGSKKIDTFVKVLEAARNETTENKIVSECDLNRKLATHLLKLLLDLDLLDKKQNSPISYLTTEKGLRFLQEYRQLKVSFDSEPV